MVDMHRGDITLIGKHSLKSRREAPRDEAHIKGTTSYRIPVYSGNNLGM